MSADADVKDFGAGMHARLQPRANLHQEIVAEIGKRIVGGLHQPGDVLPTEAELGAQLGVSRNGIREAVKVLAAKGLIVSRTKQGITVCPRRNWNMLDPEILRWCVATGATRAFTQSVYEVRKIIEPNAAAIAARDATPQSIARIEAAYADMSDTDEDLSAASAADLRFHLAILEATNNVFLRSFGVLIETALAATIQSQNSRPGAFAMSKPLHGVVLEAIRAGDPQAAMIAMNNLLDDAVETLDLSRTGATQRARHAKRRPVAGRRGSAR